MILLHLHHNSAVFASKSCNDPIDVYIEKDVDLKSNGAREIQGGEKWKMRRQNKLKENNIFQEQAKGKRQEINT